MTNNLSTSAKEKQTLICGCACHTGTGNKTQLFRMYKLQEAKKIAEGALAQLAPHCKRIAIAGSIRREVAEVKDIEIVAIPKPYETGLFEDGLAKVVNQWEKVKGEMIYGKVRYTQRILPQGIKLDLFFAEEGNWGLIFAMRTGSAEFSHRILATTWSRKGYKSEGGYLKKGELIREIREEEALFRLLDLDYSHPSKRHLPSPSAL